MTKGIPLIDVVQLMLTLENYERLNPKLHKKIMRVLGGDGKNKTKVIKEIQEYDKTL